MEINDIAHMLEKHIEQEDKKFDKLFDGIQTTAVGIAEIKMEIKGIRKDTDDQGGAIQANTTEINDMKIKFAYSAGKYAAFITFLMLALEHLLF